MDQLMLNEKQNEISGLDISARVELVDIRVIKSSFEQTPEVNRGKKKVDVTRKTDLQIDKEKELLFVVADFDLKASIEGIQSPVIIIKVSFLLVYRLRDFSGLTDESYKSFAEVNAVFNAWPYWREFVQNVTVRMGLPPLTIPVFRIVGTDKEENANNDISGEIVNKELDAKQKKTKKVNAKQKK